MSLPRHFRTGCLSLLRSSSGEVIRPVVAWSLFLLTLIQAMQPHFFLTSDNLDQLFPVWTEAGRHLLHGENPFVSQYLYGGNYPLYKDPTFLSCFHPLVLLISLLANTPLRFFTVDIFASFQILASCVAMAWLLITLQQRRFVNLAAWQTIVISLGYGFSGFNIIVGSFWFFYVANQVALPLYFTGFFLEKRRNGILLIGAAGVHAFLSGVPSSYLFTLLACSVAVGLEGLASRNFETFLRWVWGQILVTVLLSPILYFTISGFLDSSRGQGTSALPPDLFSVPFFTLCLGWFLAGIGGIFGPAFSLINTSTGLSYALFIVATSWWLPACIWAAFREKRSQSWDLAILGAVIFSLFLTARPAWLQQLFHILPFFKSTRWPFRETFIFTFFLSLWMACYVDRISKKWLLRLLAPGLILLVVSLIYFEPDAIRYHQTDRSLLFSGRAQKHWQQYLESVAPGTILIPVLDPGMMAEREKDLPLTLLGADNYPAYFGVLSMTGYSSTPPRSAIPMGHDYSHPFGYVPPEWLELLKTYGSQPTAVSRIEGLDPMHVVVQDRNQSISIIVFPEKKIP